MQMHIVMQWGGSKVDWAWGWFVVRLWGRKRGYKRLTMEYVIEGFAETGAKENFESKGTLESQANRDNHGATLRPPCAGTARILEMRGTRGHSAGTGPCSLAVCDNPGAG